MSLPWYHGLSNVSGIYLIVNTVNGKRYVGSSIKIKNRLKDHYYRLNGKRHDNKHLQCAWNKYGKDAFRFMILEEHDEDVLLTFEQFWINMLNPEYNIVKTPVMRGCSGYRHSAEAKEQMRIRAKANPMQITQAFRDAGRARQLGSKQSRETIEKRAKNNPNRRPVICIDTGTIYDSAKAAGRAIGVDPSCIAKCCRGKVRTIKALRWAFVA